MKFIAQFTNKIVHIKGTDNIVADTLLRIPEINAITSNDINFEILYKEQMSDIELPKFININNSKINMKQYDIPALGLKIWCETTYSKPRPFIPLSMRNTIFNKLHSLSHPGTRATRKLIQSKYFWPNMRKFINDLCSKCISCQKSKINKYTKSVVNKIEIPPGRFEHIHLDLVGPLPVSNGYKYLLTIIDRYTRWPEVYPLRDISATTIAKTFVQNYVSRFGVPLKITADQGTQFTSRLFSELTKLIGSHKIHTTAYHPQANGMIERFHRQIKTSIMTSNDIKHWSDILPFILLGLRTSVKEDLKCSSSELVYGQTLRIPGELIVPQENNTCTSETLQRLKNHFSHVRSNIVHHNKSKSYIPKALNNCEYVFLLVNNPHVLQQPYDGPFKVISRTEKNFIIKIGNINKTVSIDRVKPAHINSDCNNINHLSNSNNFLIN